MLIYNSLTQQKEVFKPLKAKHVSMYVCGMTVYDHCHLGHARSMLCFDMISRYLRWSGYTVNYVRNITDIDDKIIARAHEQQQTVTQLSDYFIESMHQDERALSILPPDHEPRATDHIAAMQTLIQALLDKGLAYHAKNGDICYNIASFEGYGKLSGKDIEGLEAGKRVAVDDAKRSPLDFVLWKSAKPGEPEWESPWGAGRPGWHIECSAMAHHYLGETFDIHGGGFDLQFPHHDNEIAQSEGAHGKPLAHYWMHVGFLRVDQEKMSKSLGNFFMIRDVLKKYSKETIRYFLLSSHYRSQLNYSDENLNHAKQSLSHLYQSLRDITAGTTPSNHLAKQKFIDAMEDDFNTPKALAVLFDLSHNLNRASDKNNEQTRADAALLCELGGVLGLLQQQPNDFLQEGMQAGETDAIEALIKQREQARQAKDWGVADALRQQLQDLGVELEDRAGKTLWRRV